MSLSDAESLARPDALWRFVKMSTQTVARAVAVRLDGSYPDEAKPSVANDGLSRLKMWQGVCHALYCGTRAL